MELLLVPGLVASLRRVAVARPTARNPLSLFAPLLSILPTSGSFSLLLIALDNEAILRLAAIALPNFHGSVLDQMRLLRVEHLPIKILGSLAVAEVAVRPCILHLLLGGVNHEGYKGKASGPSRVLVAHDCHVDELSHLLEVRLDVGFYHLRVNLGYLPLVEYRMPPMKNFMYTGLFLSLGAGYT
jgi:hypothetical protein